MTARFLLRQFVEAFIWYTMKCIRPSQRCISSRLLTDNIFEIETTALAHVVCAPRESGILLKDFAAAYPSVNHSWIFHVLETTELPEFICRFLRRIYYDSTYTRRIRRYDPRSVPHGHWRETRLSGKWLLVCDGLRPHLSMASRRNHSKESCWPGLSTAGLVCVC